MTLILCAWLGFTLYDASSVSEKTKCVGLLFLTSCLLYVFGFLDAIYFNCSYYLQKYVIILWVYLLCLHNFFLPDVLVCVSSFQKNTVGEQMRFCLAGAEVIIN